MISFEHMNVLASLFIYFYSIDLKYGLTHYHYYRSSIDSKLQSTHYYYYSSSIDPNRRIKSILCSRYSFIGIDVILQYSPNTNELISFMLVSIVLIGSKDDDEMDSIGDSKDSKNCSSLTVTTEYECCS